MLDWGVLAHDVQTVILQFNGRLGKACKYIYGEYLELAKARI